MGIQQTSKRSLIQKKLKPHQHLLAVSKLQPVEKIKSLYIDGQRDFAENYVQEALQKIELLKDLAIQWHLIGPLQKNKVKFLKKNFTYIHSVDSYELALKISNQALEIHHRQKIFIQVNLAEEPTKSGFTQSEFAVHWPKLSELTGVEIVGLMTMPPLENEPENNRKIFQELIKLGKSLNLNEFSMGTSHDYSVALEEGATWIRLGTLLFGDRI